MRIDLGEREDTATVTIPVAGTVLAGPGADRITVDGPGHELSGGEGNDALHGGAGDDVLSGDQGADVIDGGPGGDRIAARDGAGDDVSCGDGADTVEADTLDSVALDCERRHAGVVPSSGGRRRAPAAARRGCSDAPELQALEDRPRVRHVEQARRRARPGAGCRRPGVAGEDDRGASGSASAGAAPF